MAKSNESQRLRVVRDTRAEQAAQSQKLKDRLSKLSSNVDRQLSVEDQLRADLATAQEQLAQTQADLGTSQAQLQAKTAENGTLTTKVSVTDEALAAAEAKCNELYATNAEQAEEITGLHQHLETACDELERVNDKLERKSEDPKGITDGDNDNTGDE